MNFNKPKKILEGNNIYVVVDQKNNVCVFDLIEENNKKWINPDGKCLSTNEEVYFGDQIIYYKENNGHIGGSLVTKSIE